MTKQLDFYIDTVDVVNENVLCDKLRLNQILLNLLSSVMEFTKPGGMVSVRTLQQSGFAVDVADDGAVAVEKMKEVGMNGIL